MRHTLISPNLGGAPRRLSLNMRTSASCRCRARALGSRRSVTYCFTPSLRISIHPRGLGSSRSCRIPRHHTINGIPRAARSVSRAMNAKIERTKVSRVALLSDLHDLTDSVRARYAFAEEGVVVRYRGRNWWSKVSANHRVDRGGQ